MQIVNFGSLNIDHVYGVERFARAGETLDTRRYEVFAGGKGFNQSIALARAGARVAHAGCVGDDGRWLVEMLEREGVDTAGIQVVDAASGHAVIQVSEGGENAILIHGGANRSIDAALRRRVFDRLGPDTTLLLQNEINDLAAVIEGAAAVGAPIVLNPSPVSAGLRDLPLGGVSLFVLNQGEGAALSGAGDPDEIVGRLRERHPNAAVLLTLGADGARYADREGRVEVSAEPAEPVDTTGAGDTFTGFFVASRAAGIDVEASLRRASRAAAWCVARPGAAASIPTRADLGE